MRNALIFSPCFDGHRQVYVFVITNILEELGYKITLAGNFQEKITNSFYVNKLQLNPAITCIDTYNFSRGGLDISLKEFLAIQGTCKADLTIFTEADSHISLFISQIFKRKNKLRGKVVGIFMRPFHHYEPRTTFQNLKFVKQLPDLWNKDESIFYNFFLKRFKLLDVSLCIDENFVRSNPKFKWLPDVFQQFADSIVKPDEKSSQRFWIEKLNKFIEKNKSRFVLLYFGTSQHRRGYDTLLKLAEETGSAFIHCGIKDKNVNFQYDTDQIINTLENEERILETDTYIEDSLCVEQFFRAASHLVLPYKDFFGSSGVMLQALEYGIPVLASDLGLIGFRINKYDLGFTYNTLEKNSLEKSFQSFKTKDPKSFGKKISAYMDIQSAEQLKIVLTNAFEGTSYPVNLPPE